MIDLHSHILPGVDDGSKNLEESLNILRQLEKLGFTEVFLTPHYIEESKYTSTKAKNLPVFKKLQNAAKKEKINIGLNLANEVFVSVNLPKLAKTNKIATINKKYVLFELPLHGEINNLLDIVHEIKIAGFIPILAHPERYDFVKKDPKVINEFRENGVLIQCNYGSIIGKYGKHAKKTLKYLLEQRLVDIMSSDVHHENSSLLTKMPKMLKKIRRIAGKPYFDYLTNAEAIRGSMNNFAPKKKHTGLKIVGGIFGIILIALGIIAGFYLKRTNDYIEAITSDSEGVEQVTDITSTPFVFYISGIDVAGDIETESLSDVNIVMAVNPNTSKILIVNIPRDYYVPIIHPDANGTKDKLTHTGILGVQTGVATIENFMDIDIDYYLRVNFSTLEGLVDLIQGIEIDSDVEFTSYHYKNCHYYYGKNLVDGRCALGYARDRQSQSLGDITRAEHQGRVLEAIIAKIFEPSFFVANYLTILDETIDDIQTDISSDNLNKLIDFEINQRPNWQVERYALNEFATHNYGYLVPGELLWMGEPDWDTVETAKDKINLLLEPGI